jgi:type I restriction enzyme S subunit
VSWPMIALGEIAKSVDYGLTASATDRPVGPKFLRITDIQDDAVDWRSVPNCIADAAQLSRNRLADGDIVFARTGATTGKSFLVRNPPTDAVFASYLIRVRPSDRLDAAFLAHFFRSPGYWNQIEKAARGAAQPGVNASILKELVVPLPTLEEQRRIAAILDKAYAIRRKREQALALADDFLKSVFLEAFGRPNRLNPTLKVLPLGELCDLFAGNSLPAGEAYVGQDGGLLLLKVGDLNLPGNDQVVITAREWVAEKGRTGAAIVAPKDAIVFPKRGGAIATNKKRVLGRSCILDPNLMAVAPKRDARISYPYLRVWFELLDLASISNGSTVPQLNKGDIYPLEMPIPARDDLMRFDALFRNSNKVRGKKADDMTSAETLFSALSQRAFRGEL